MQIINIFGNRSLQKGEMTLEEKQIKEQLPYAYWLHAIWPLSGRKLWMLTEKIGMPKQIYECETDRMKEVLNP